MQELQTRSFWFKITPTQIIPNPKPKLGTTASTNINKTPNENVQSSKSIFIKLGNKQGKCKSIGTSLQLVVQIAYYNKTNKYCPLRGIIKIYDVNKDGLETISCVGAFNAESLLDEKEKTTHLQRDIGLCKILMTVEVKKLNEQGVLNKQNKIKNKETVTLTIPSKKEPQLAKCAINSNSSNSAQINQHLSAVEKQNIGFKLKNLNRPFTKSPKSSQKQCQLVPYMIDDSSQEISRSRNSEKEEQNYKNQRELIGQQLVQERRKNKQLQQKIQKCNTKVQALRKGVSIKNNQIKLYCQAFKNFIAGLELDSNGKYVFEMNERKRQISLRYKVNINFRQTFENFIQFMAKKMNEVSSSYLSSQKSVQQQIQINKILTKLQRFQQQKTKIYQQNYKLMQQISSFKSLLDQKNIQIQSKTNLLNRKIEQICSYEQRYKKLLQQKKNFEDLNQFLRDRDAKMQNLINSRQSTIQQYKRMLNNVNRQVYQYQRKIDQLCKKIDNYELVIDQMKQQNYNLMETIESYRVKYGDLKQMKDKTLERELKQCLRWIEQQNREQELNLEETSYSESHTVNSIMKSIGQIQNMPLQQISVIRKEVISVLKKLDQFVAKNSLGGISS